MNLLDIGEVASRANVPPSTLRYYEEVGLISSVSRRGLRRQFEPDVMIRLALVALARTAGFSLSEIAAFFGKGELMQEMPRDALHAKADELDKQINKLAALRDTLRHVADCSAPSHMECPKFRQLLRSATRP
ncbi:MAG: helix-turn-helix domain-containing protein [Cohaesibacteraceae bacterium]